ncbi:hypothetical protein K474DRAFT_1672242 [Panus rudis PR-1116 ss-1]|nr:hypothetical protein K474DRAFT_1672242 [Panus rudis PR-1116 ss-1]
MASNSIYLAVFDRAKGDNSVHVAILFTPQNPPANQQTSFMLHAMNYPIPKTKPSDPEIGWKFQSRPAFARTPLLRSLVLLGTTKRNAAEIEDLLKKVPVGQGNDFDCQVWAMDAVRYLTKSKTIPQLRISLDDLYKIAKNMAIKFQGVKPEDRMKRAIPTCDTAGNEIQSEVL